MATQNEIFLRAAEGLLRTAENALEEAISYLHDVPPTADVVVALETAQEALDVTHGASMALRTDRKG